MPGSLATRRRIAALGNRAPPCLPRKRSPDVCAVRHASLHRPSGRALRGFAPVLYSNVHRTFSFLRLALPAWMNDSLIQPPYPLRLLPPTGRYACQVISGDSRKKNPPQAGPVPIPARPGGGHRLHLAATWDRRAPSWDHGALPGLQVVVDRVIETAGPAAGAVVLDLGCGTGSLALPLAGSARRVVAVDLSRGMLDELRAKAESGGIANIEVVRSSIEELQAEPESMDLVVSNYALHHLRDTAKQAVVRRAFGWLRPGGRIVIGDMMFGRGATGRDRQIIASKLVAFAKKGPAGWWRIVKNVARFTLRFQERPAPVERWTTWLGEAGFEQVKSIEVHAEAAVVVGVKPRH